MIETPISKTATVAEIILAELATSVEPLTSGDLYERLELDHGDTVIHRAITSLLKDGRIELDEPRMGRRGQMAKTYRLSRSDATRLMAHLEAELESSAEVDQADIQTRMIHEDLDHAAASHNGDELHVIHAHIPCETAANFADLAAKHTDPIIRALAQMDIREPRFQEGQMHVDRLRALASHLDEGKPVLPQMDLVSWLLDLAATLEEMAT